MAGFDNANGRNNVPRTEHEASERATARTIFLATALAPVVFVAQNMR